MRYYEIKRDASTEAFMALVAASRSISPAFESYGAGPERRHWDHVAKNCGHKPLSMGQGVKYKRRSRHKNK